MTHSLDPVALLLPLLVGGCEVLYGLDLPGLHLLLGRQGLLGPLALALGLLQLGLEVADGPVRGLLLHAELLDDFGVLSNLKKRGK